MPFELRGPRGSDVHERQASMATISQPFDSAQDKPFDKACLKERRGRIALEATSSVSPSAFLRQHSALVDDLVRTNFRKSQTHHPIPSVCLMAVGGYGRAELAPCSDIDLLLLHSSSNPSSLAPLIEETLYPLWDLGLDVSCSARSVVECLKMAKHDLQVKIGLIDGRYLDGEFELFRSLQARFAKNILHHKIREFAKALMAEIRQRHSKYSDPAFILEPNVKDGIGGLRDFHIGRWMVRAKYRTDRLESVLFPDHSRSLEGSVEFLWAVRHQLHLLSERRQDDLTFEWQEKVAPILGYPSGERGIEEMMRRYQLSAQRIDLFSSGVLERALAEPSGIRRLLFHVRRGKIDKTFEIREGEIHLLDPTLLKRDPSHLMTLFLHCQDHHLKMDYRTEEAVLEALPFLNDGFRQSEKVNAAFRSLLRKGKDLGSLLRKMHELGFLSRILPEFSDIEGKVHYDLYHVHPVDVHSILACEELEKLSQGDYRKDLPLLSTLMGDQEHPEILFLTALLHDIGKGRESDHSLVGSEIAGTIAARLGFSPDERGLIQFLVRHHLLMATTAFHRDLSDEQTIVRFSHPFKNVTELKMLYLLTFADIKAVGPDAWTSWKDTLLMDLFIKTSHLLEGREWNRGFSGGSEMVERLNHVLPPEAFSEYVDSLPERYLNSYPPEEIAHHISMARSLGAESLSVTWKTDEGKRATVTVCTKDRHGLFAHVTGTLFRNRLNILEAKVHTWGNHVALETFRVDDATGEIERRLKQFKIDLKGVLNGTDSEMNLLTQNESPRSSLRRIIPRVPAEVKVHNHDSDFYTILEITGEDRMGILSDVAQALTDHGCTIHFARISTFGNRIIDVFYIQNRWGEKIEDGRERDRLTEILLHLLTEHASSPSLDKKREVP